ncbi:MAG: type III pantothenate kinase, partial [Raineya sp.]|nr:type III pantothenate kinase [Raineya sp.]
MKNVTIDLGNSRYKTALFENNRLVEGLETTDQDLLLRTIEGYQADNFIVSSVRNDTEILARKLPKKPLIFDSSVPVPIENCYKSPQTLGTDRLAAAIGAKALFPDKPCLVI